MKNELMTFLLPFKKNENENNIMQTMEIGTQLTHKLCFSSYARIII